MDGIDQERRKLRRQFVKRWFATVALVVVAVWVLNWLIDWRVGWFIIPCDSIIGFTIGQLDPFRLWKK